MESIVQWLEELGFAQYGAAFVQDDIDHAVLRDLSETDLQKLGVTLGHRKRLLRAIAELSEPASRPPVLGAPSPEAERRQLSVLFCDLVNSTALAARLDPEDLREVIGAYHRRCAQVIEHARGFVAKYMGDGVLAYFGYPHASEDDAERAVSAGLELVDAVRQLEAGTMLQARVGIETGLVVVGGDLIGRGAAREQAVVGETPNVAARLQSLADPGMVVIGPRTRRLLGRLFEYGELGPVALKGLAEPVRAWQVLGRSTVASRFEALRSAATPLVGRAEETDLLLRRWEQAFAGEGRVVSLVGEPGIGKSRLAATLDGVTAEAHLRVRFFCSPQRLASALHPFIEQLEHVAGFDRSDPVETRLAKLEALLQPLNASAEHFGLLAALLSLPFGAAPIAVLNRKEKIFEAWIAMVEALAAKQPLLMLFEDVHWIDPTSLELLSLALERVARLPVLALITARPEFRPPWPAAAHLTTMVLTRLGRPEAAALVERVAGGRALPAEILKQILARADGVPLFLEELTRSVLESGHLHETDGRYVVRGPLPPLAIPATLQDSLMARLDRLGPAREVAQIGSALGRQFSYALIGAIAALPPQQLDDALQRLASADVLQRRGAPPAAEYTFRHALVQDAAYATLLRSRRQPLHARIAATLEAQFPETGEKQPEVLAHHFTEAGLGERAVGYWLRAGRQMLTRSGMAEAEALLNKGLGVLSDLPDSPRRREQELDLQIGLGQALLATRGYGAPAVGAAYARARQLCDELNRPDKLLPILHGNLTHHLVRGNLEQARRLTAQLRELGETRNDAVTRVMAYRVVGFDALYSGRFTEARACLEQGLALYRPSDQSAYAELAIQDALVSLLSFSSLALACCGCLDQARSRSDAALAEARRIAHAHSLAHALAAAWRVAWLARSEPVALLRFADELMAVSAARGFALWRSFALANRGWCLTALGNAAQGIPLLNAGLAENQATGTGFQTPAVLELLADAYRLAGEPDIALARVADAARLAERMQVKWLHSETLRLRGDLLMLGGDIAGAESSYRDAMQLARSQEGKLFELRASTNLARLWRDQERPAEARELLAPIAGWFSEGLDTPDIREADGLLLQLAGS